MSGELPEEPVALSRDERRIRAAQDVLRTTIRDLYLGHVSSKIRQAPLDLKLTLRVDPADQWNLSFNPPMLEQLLPQLADNEAARDVCALGRVYCFRCGSSACGHAQPSSPLEVFKGYDATGRPEWQEFTQALIDEKDQRVDLLYARPPRPVALFQFGRALKGKQLLAFGKSSLSYSILAQVVAGYFDLNGERLAVTLQLVEGRDKGGALTLQLNPVACGLSGSSWVEWLSIEKSAVLFRAIQIAERELERIETSVRLARSASNHASANQWMGRIPGVARRLAEALSRGARQTERRTRHAEVRRQDQRPVHKALEDAAAVLPQNWFYDVKAKTMIAVGDRGRVHAFNHEGKHVTSFIIKPATVDFRVRTGRWRLATMDEITATKSQLSGTVPAAPPHLD